MPNRTSSRESIPHLLGEKLPPLSDTELRVGVSANRQDYGHIRTGSIALSSKKTGETLVRQGALLADR